jgi:hypothetical protein
VLLVDVNVLVHAHRQDTEDHAAMRSWLTKALVGRDPVGISDLVLSGFLRVTTHPKVFKEPTPLKRALEFAEAVRTAPAAVRVTPGERHWEIFTRLCREASGRGNLVADAFHAALAIEAGAEWVTSDRDYARFAGLRWRHPLQGP